MSNIKPGSTNYFHLGGKIDPISEIKNAGVLTSGNVYWVKDPSDGDYLAFKDSVGADNLFDTVQGAIDKCTNDYNDYVFVCPKKNGSAWTLTTSVNLDKNRVHLISLGYGANVSGQYSNSLVGFGTGDLAAVPTYGLLNITGSACEVAGFHFQGTAGTCLVGSVGADAATGAGLISVRAPGLWMHDCKVEITGNKWDSGTPVAMVMGGSTVKGVRFDNVFFNAGTKTAGAMAAVQPGFSGVDWEFYNCRFQKHAIATTDTLIKGNGGTIVGNHVLAEKCVFINTNTGTIPDSALGGSLPSTSEALLADCYLHRHSAGGTNASVYVTPLSAGGTVATLLENWNISGVGTALLAAV